MKLPLSIRRAQETSTGWKGLSIMDADGFAIANLVFQLDDSEVENARLIVKTMNASFRQDSLALEVASGVE